METLSTIIHDHEQQCASLELSETIHELQRNLQAALEVASGLKKENEILKSNLEDSRASNFAQQRRNAEWREVWKKEVDLVSKREKKLLQDQSSWDSKLADKRRELDDIEEQIMKRKEETRNENAFHVQGDSNSAKLEFLEKEVDNWRKRFFDTQKLSESEKVQQAESKYLREAALTLTLRKENASLQNLYAERVAKDNSNKQNECYQERVRELTIKVEEMEFEAEKLRVEAKEMRQSRDETMGRCDTLIANHLVENGRIMLQVAKYEAMSKTHQERIQMAEREVTEKAAEIKGLQETLGNASTTISLLKDTLATKAIEHGEELKQLRQCMTRSDHELTSRLAQAQTLVTDEKAKTAKAELLHKQAQESHIQIVKQIVKEIEGNRDDTKERLLIAQDRIRKIENKLSDLESEKVQLIHNANADIQRLQHACESCHNDLNMVMLQKEEVEKMCEITCSRASQQTKELEEYERAMMKADEQYQLLMLENEALKERVQIASDKTLAATTEADIWKDKSSKAQKKAGEVVKEVRSQLSKVQRKSEAYKQKALQAHQRNIEAKMVLESLRKDTQY